MSKTKKNGWGAMLTYKQLANLLEMPVGTLYYMVSTNQIPFIRLGGRIVRFSESEVEKWLDENRSSWKGRWEKKLGVKL